MEQINDKLVNFASIIADNTLEQAIMSSSMPFIRPHLALMPDAHLGLGATVGSVIPTIGSIMPAAVGVDIGCLDAETEFLSPDGWVKISEWDNHEVLNYDPETDKSVFVAPERYINLPCEEFYHFKNSKGMDQMVSQEHRMLVFSGFKSKGYSKSVLNPGKLAENPLKNGYYSSKCSFASGESGLDISDDMIRLEVMVQADGRVRKTAAGNNAIEIHLRKQRKIDRAIGLLSAESISYRTSFLKDGSTLIACTVKEGYCDKDLSKYWRASPEQLHIIAEESLLWDGHSGYRSYYCSTDKASADLIQYAFSANGVRSGISISVSDREGHNDVYVVTPTKNSMVGYCDPVIVPSVDGRKYCFTINTGFFVARRNGKIFTTGNCGMRYINTRIRFDPEVHTNEKLHELRLLIQDVIPVGKAMNRDLDTYANDNIATLEALASDTDLDPDLFHANWRLQLGSLGGGNHFIEVVLNEDDEIGLFLHSGSRGIGNMLARDSIEVAKAETGHLDIPHQDLAYLSEGTESFRVYIDNLNWAQNYAKLNRDVMMSRLSDSFASTFYPGDSEFANELRQTEFVDCHHNYTEYKYLDGIPTYLSRKGAIDASVGVMGLIPGSMGDLSYVVEGKGSVLGLDSAPHGAGRTRSRNSSKKEISMDEFKSSMSKRHIEYDHDVRFLDEAPAAYKPIAQVMEDAKDLVKIRHTLRQIVNVKG